MKLAVFVLLLSICAGAQAAAYKCTGANGAIAFQDRPCAGKTGAEIHVDGIPAAHKPEENAAAEDTDPNAPPVPKPKKKPKPDGASIDLGGSWCDYAVSVQPEAKGDESKKAEWDFSTDTMSYRAPGATERKSASYTRERDELYIDNALLGGKDRPWIVMRLEDDELLLQEPGSGYHHLRRGTCDEAK